MFARVICAARGDAAETRRAQPTASTKEVNLTKSLRNPGVAGFYLLVGRLTMLSSTGRDEPPLDLGAPVRYHRHRRGRIDRLQHHEVLVVWHDVPVGLTQSKIGVLEQDAAPQDVEGR